MNKNAAYPEPFHPRLCLPPIALAVVGLLLFVGLSSTASAAPAVSKDGKIRACYRVKGKPKGSLRIVPGKARCKRGERKLVWSVAASSGQAGATGQVGAAGGGSQGQPGTSGAPGSNEATLKTQVATLSLQVEALEKTLEGVTNGDLEGTLATLSGLDNADLLGAVETVEGLTNTDLKETVESLPAVDSVCEQSEELTSQVNMVSDVVEGLGLSPALEALGLLEIPTLPEALDPFSCNTP